MTDHPVIHLANALTQVAIFVREGLSELDGLKAVTINAARINQIEDRVGSIEVGKDFFTMTYVGEPVSATTEFLGFTIKGLVLFFSNLIFLPD